MEVQQLRLQMDVQQKMISDYEKEKVRDIMHCLAALANHYLIILYCII
jgi:hypothetical protein